MGQPKMGMAGLWHPSMATLWEMGVMGTQHLAMPPGSWERAHLGTYVQHGWHQEGVGDAAQCSTPTLLNLQQGLIFDTFLSPWAHRSPVAVLTAWAAKAGSALQPVGEQRIHSRASGEALGWPERRAGSCHIPSPVCRKGMRWGVAQVGLG